MVPVTLPPGFPGPSQILFGRGRFADVPPECLRLGNQGVVVHGRALLDRMGLWKAAVQKAGGDHFFLYHYDSKDEPTVGEVDRIIRFAREQKAEFICAVGGGSVIDAAKAAAGLFNESHPTAHYHAGAVVEKAGLPFVAVPTTAGSGAEATPNAVLIDPARNEKASIRDNRFLARTVVLDGELLPGAPRFIIAASGCDAFAQGVESALSRHATPETMNLAHHGLKLVAGNLVPFHRGIQGDSADRLLAGSFLIGAAFSVSRLGVIHGLAHPLGLIYGVPHGLVCAFCLLPALRLNRLFAEEAYEAASSAIQSDLILFSEKLIRDLGLTSPFHGKPILEKDKIIAATLASGSTKANPKTITRDDVERMLDELFFR